MGLSVLTCYTATGVPHRATVKMKPTKSAFKLYPKSACFSPLLSLYLVQRQDLLPGPTEPPPLPVPPPTAATRGRREHPSQIFPPSSAHSPPGLPPQWGKSPSPTRVPQGPPFLPFSPELTLLQSHGPPCCSFNERGLLRPQGLCTDCALCPDHSSSTYPLSSLPHLHQGFLRLSPPR